MYASDSLYKTGQILTRVDGSARVRFIESALGHPSLEAFAPLARDRAAVAREIKRIGSGERASGRGFYAHLFDRSRHHNEVGLDEIQKAVALDDYARRSHAFERASDSEFDLLGRDDCPMNLCGSSVPKASRILPRNVCLHSPRPYERLVAEQVADAACLRVFPARAVMAARHLYRLPTGKRSNKFANERRLSRIGREAPDGDDRRREGVSDFDNFRLPRVNHNDSFTPIVGTNTTCGQSYEDCDVREPVFRTDISLRAQRGERSSGENIQTRKSAHESDQKNRNDHAQRVQNGGKPPFDVEHVSRDHVGECVCRRRTY